MPVSKETQCLTQTAASCSSHYPAVYRAARVLQVTQSPQFESYRTMDVVQLLGVGVAGFLNAAVAVVHS